MYSKTAELFKNYSEQLNIAGGAAPILGGGAMMVAGAAHPGLIDSSTVNHAYLFSGCALAMAGTLNVNKTVETRLIEDGRMDPEDSWHHQHLAGEYDSPAKEIAYGTLTDDEIPSSPTFQKAIRTTFTELKKDPGGRSAFAQMIRNNPAAHAALINTQTQMDEADSKNSRASADPTAQQAPNEREDEAESLTLR